PLINWSTARNTKIVGGPARRIAGYARRQVGGLTGDIDGALIEVLEVATLRAIVVGLEQDWLGPLLWNGG
ncbi:MAG: hypothetical protein O6913_10880, partial [Chloroflexi bacterium]|nr:hypothetical protein [Chloroflexota bacterium]